MRSSESLLAAALLGALLLAPLPSLGTELAPLLPLEEVEIGDRGVVRTVLRGVEPVDLPLELVGVLEDYLGPGRDLILARLEGEQAEFTGVAAGMSGSPVYVDGRLVGALAYSFGIFGKEPIAGVTPIELMLEGGAAGSAGGGEGATPLATPLVMVGVPPAVREEFADEWEALGLQPVEGAAGAGGEHAANAELRPGSPVAAVLASGDATIAATGTVTRVEGDRVWAFGHPFLGEGEIEVPMARAEVVWTLASWASSSKISSVGEVVGAVYQDRLPAIRGKLGARAATASLALRIDWDPSAPHRSDYEIIRHRQWTPVLVESLVASAIFDSPELETRYSYRARAALRLEGGAAFDLDLVVANPAERINGPFLLARELGRQVRLATDTPFGTAALDSLEVEVEPLSGRGVALVEDVAVADTLVHPGDRLAVQIFLRDGEGRRRALPLTVEVPADIRPGTLELHVGSELALEPVFGQPWEARRRSASNLAAWHALLGEQPRGHVLSARLARPAEGVVLGGELYPSLPATVARTLRSRTGGPRGFRLRRAIVAEAATRTDLVLEGSRKVTLQVAEAEGRSR